MTTSGSKVVRFPICRQYDGLHWYGGQCYENIDAVMETMSDRDWRRIVRWESRNMDRIITQADDKQRSG